MSTSFIPWQAAYRGHIGRKEYRSLLAAHQEQQRMQREREAAALAVIAPWAETFKARVWFLRARRAAPVLQAWWRREFQRRQAAAVVIQAAVRCFLARLQLQRSRQAAVVVQVSVLAALFWQEALPPRGHDSCVHTGCSCIRCLLLELP